MLAASESATAPEKDEATKLVVAMMGLQAHMAPFQDKAVAGEWEAALQLLERFPREERGNTRVLLLEARCQQQLGRHANAQRGAALSKRFSYCIGDVIRASKV